MVFCNNTFNITNKALRDGHNPYFNRWFSAISNIKKNVIDETLVTILILIDSFLQFIWRQSYNN